MILLNSRNKGVSLDSNHKLTTKDTASNLYVQGSTGSGKGVNVLIPTLLTLETSAVVIDTGNVFESTAGYLQSIGYEIRRLNLKDKGQSWRFNPLHRVGDSYSRAKKVAKQLIKTAMGEAKGSERFWNLSAESFAATCIALICQQTDRRFHNMANLLHLTNSIARGKFPTDLLETAHQTIYDDFMATVANDKTLPSVISTIKAALELYSDPQVALLSSEDTIAFEDLRGENNKLVIYITCSESEVSYYKSYFSLFLLSLWDFLLQSGSETAPICQVHLDEFSNLGELENIVETLSQNRKKNCPAVIYTQSMTSVKSIYGADVTSSLINGCTQGKLFLPGQEDPETLNYLERVLGRCRQVYRDRKGRKHEEVRSVLAIPEIRSYPKSIFLRSKTLPVRFTPKPFYKDKKLLKRSQIPVQQLVLPVHKAEVEYFDQPN